MKIILIALLPFLVLFSDGSDHSLPALLQNVKNPNTGTLEKMIAANGSVTMDLNLKQLSGGRSAAKTVSPDVLRFAVEHDSFFTILVFNSELRGSVPSSMKIIPQNGAALPAKLNASSGQLVIESMEWGSQYELAIRDAKTGFTFFNIEGQEPDYDAGTHLLNIDGGRLLVSKEFAADLGRPTEAGSVVGNISIQATMRPIEVTQVVDGETRSDVLPASPDSGSVLGPDVIVGDLPSMAQFGSSSGTQVGLAVATTSCNLGTVPLDWFATPGNDHPVIPQNLYRMSGGTSNNDRFEQIGQSNVKHAFLALQNNACSLGCNANPDGTALGSGCSDPYDASLNAGPSLGSRAWINPFTGAYPRGDSATPPNNHGSGVTAHVHNGTSHRIVTEIADLNTSLNPGATYYAESQYITPHEYAWCQTHAGQCNMYNNVSHRRYTVIGTASPFSFSPAAATVQSKPAIGEWAGSSGVSIEPSPGADGIGTVAYKVTNPSPGVWHYEYAIYNQNLDRAIQSFSVPVDAGVSLSNIGFHMPPQQPGWTFDGTVGNAGYSSTPWAQTQAAGTMTWSSETFLQNPNANAIRWGTLYNFRFDSNRPPHLANATIGFFKTGSPINVQIQVPLANVSVSGRVTTLLPRGVLYAQVTLTDSNQNTRTAYTSSFGYFNFDNVPAGVTYTISVVKRHFSFTPRTMPANDNLTAVNFAADPTY